MNKLVIPAVLAATGMLAAAAWSQNTLAFQNGGARMATGFPYGSELSSGL